jgi:hypothetical protein
MTAEPTAGYLCVKWLLASCRTSDIVRSQNWAWCCEHQAIPLQDPEYMTVYTTQQLFSLPSPCSRVLLHKLHLKWTVTAFRPLRKLLCFEHTCESKPTCPISAIKKHKFRQTTNMKRATAHLHRLEDFILFRKKSEICKEFNTTSKFTADL